MTDKSLSTEPMLIPDVVRGLSLLSGLSQQELAVRAGVSPGSVTALYDRGASIGEIARKAGVSRQRIHKLAMDHGRPRRREQHREQRVALGRETLGLVRPSAR